MAELLHTNGSRVKDHPRLDPERDLAMSVPGRFTVAAAGDIVMTRGIAKLDDPAVQAALSPIREADVSIANLEQSIGNRKTFQGHPMGIFAFLIMADPSIAEDLAACGFEILARANNRLSDYGDAGNRETDAHLRAAGITPVGFGEHLSDARAPVYRDTPRGRLAGLSATTHVNHNATDVFAPSARIGLSNGRPGANNIRVSRTITLPVEAWTRLRDLAMEHDYAFPGPFAIQPTVMVYEDRFRLGDAWYVKGESGAYIHRAHPDDMIEVVKNTRNGAYFSNFTVFNLHTHLWALDPDNPKGGIAGESLHPADGQIAIAHEAIDAGADMVCTTGPFDFRGIEIFRGKPVFHGLGSFVRQPYMQEVVPWETYRRFEFGGADLSPIHPHLTDVTDAELLFSRTAKHPARYFQGATAFCTYEDGKLVSIRLDPVDMGFDGPVSDLGIPKRATGARAEDILQPIAALSDAFGTKVKIKDGVGEISLT